MKKKTFVSLYLRLQAVLVSPPLSCARRWRTWLCSAQLQPASTRPSARSASHIPSTIAPRTTWRKCASSVLKVRNVCVMEYHLKSLQTFTEAFCSRWHCAIFCECNMCWSALNKLQPDSVSNAFVVSRTCCHVGKPTASTEVCGEVLISSFVFPRSSRAETVSRSSLRAVR